MMKTLTLEIVDFFLNLLVNEMSFLWKFIDFSFYIPQENQAI